MAGPLSPLSKDAAKLAATFANNLTDEIAALKFSIQELRNEGGNIADIARAENKLAKAERELAASTSSGANREGMSPSNIKFEQEYGLEAPKPPTAPLDPTSPKFIGPGQKAGAYPPEGQPIGVMGPSEEARPFGFERYSPREQLGPIDTSRSAIPPGKNAPTEGWKADSMFDAMPMSKLKKAGIATVGAGAVGLGATGDWGDKAETPTAPPIAPTLEPITPPAKTTPAPAAGGSVEATNSPFQKYRKIASDFDSLEIPTYKDEAGLEGESGKLAQNQKAVQAKAAELKGGLDVLMAAHEVAKGNLAKRELYEKITQAVGLIAAGLYGNKTGTDLGGVKFAPSDWTAKATDLQRDLTNTTGVLKEKYGVDIDVLNKEKQRLSDSKQEQRYKYETAFRDFDTQFRKMTTKTNEAQQERNYEDSLSRWNIEMLQRAEAAKRTGEKPSIALAKEREAELAKATSEWQTTAGGLSKLKGDAKDEAVDKLELLDRQITAMRGYSMIPAAKQYTEVKNITSGGGYEDIINNAVKQQKNIETLRTRFPEINNIIARRGTYIQNAIDSGMASGLELRDADAAATRGYNNLLNTAIRQSLSTAGKAPTK